VHVIRRLLHTAKSLAGSGFSCPRRLDRWRHFPCYSPFHFFHLLFPPALAFVFAFSHLIVAVRYIAPSFLRRYAKTHDLTQVVGQRVNRWSYKVGVFDTSGKPEIITVGRLPETGHSALNEAAKRLRAGVDLTAGRHRDLVGQVDCEFRPLTESGSNALWGGRSGITMATTFL
jgi:hypothetical protein